MIAIIDYGVGNLFSLSASLSKLNIPHEVTKDEAKINAASHIILPGVGAFGDASNALFSSGVSDILRRCAKEKPFLGICVGAQLLFDAGHEFGKFDGLGLISGDIVNIKDEMTEDLKVPHMGWNSLEILQDDPILKYLKKDDYVYFVHSFHAKTDRSNITSISKYGTDITATVRKDNIFGTQFHPEKSGDVGLSILKAFYEYTM